MRTFTFAAVMLAVALHAEEPFSFAATPGQLPKDVVPHHYRITIEPDAGTLTFEGSVRITLEVLQPTKRIRLNAAGLKISRAVLGNDRVLEPSIDEEILTLSGPETIQPGGYELTIDYSGKIAQSTKGLYRVDYQNDGDDAQMLVTQMEPADARRMLPCWDEPVYRATFELEVEVPEQRTAVSNMPVASEKPDGSGRKRVLFRPTPPMASYLLALAIGDFDVLRGEVDGIELGIYTPKGKASQAEYAMEVTKQVLPFYREYFDCPYPLPKLDQIAIPDKGGAMENWGLITYGENVLLFDRNRSSQFTRERIFGVVAHEIAHQWFGNLVTMAWWDNLWLNEGFASWMGTTATDHFNPDWEVWTRSLDGREYAMWNDAQKTTHPIQQPVGTVAEALDLFDSISYQKGQAFLRMLETYLGPEAFREGLRQYMAKHQYSSTTTSDLWNALAEKSGKPVREIASGWTEQPGFPVVNVREDGEGGLLLKQEPFVIGEPFDSKRAWAIPISLAEPNSRPAWTVISGTDEQKADRPGEVVVANPGMVGFFRIQYSPALATALAKSADVLSTEERMAILADWWALFQAGRISLEEVVPAIVISKGDFSFPATKQLLDVMGAIDWALTGDPKQDAFRQKAITMFRPRLEGVGWDKTEGEDPLVTALRSSLIATLGKWGDPAVIEEAQARYRKFTQHPETLDGDLRFPVFEIVGREADSAMFEDLETRARVAPGSEESQILYRALAQARDADLAARALKLSLDPTVPPGTATRILSNMAKGGDHAEMVWKFADENFDAISARLGSIGSNDYFPRLATELMTEDAAQRLREFAKNHLGADEAPSVDRALSDIAIDGNIRATVREQAAVLID